MKTTAIDYNHPFIMGLHSILQAQYNCCLCEIIGVRETEVKKVAVFLLRYFYSYHHRSLAIAYSMNCLYVNTVVDYYKNQYVVDAGFRNKVQEILNELEGYEEAGV